MEFSKRTNWPAEPNPWTQRLQELKRQGVKLIDLTESNPTRCGFDYLKKDLLKSLCSPKHLHYEPDPRGLEKTRQAICEYYAGKGCAVSPDRVFLTACTSEAYSYIFRLMTHPGDSVLLPRPSYPLFEFLAGLNDLKIETYDLVYEKGWFAEEKSLRAATEKKAKVGIIVNPNNPTGNFWGIGRSREMTEIDCMHSMAWISDEVFHDFSFGSAPAPSMAASEAMLTFTLGGISKILGLPQMKLSWMVLSGPDELCKEAARRLEIIADTYLSVSTPVQGAAVEWLKMRDMMISEIAARVKSNRGFLAEAVKESENLSLLDSDGGWYAVLKVPGTDEDFAEQLLSREQTIVHPGYFYDFPSDGFIVLSLIVAEEQFRNGVARIAGASLKDAVQRRA